MTGVGKASATGRPSTHTSLPPQPARPTAMATAKPQPLPGAKLPSGGCTHFSSLRPSLISSHLQSQPISNLHTSLVFTHLTNLTLSAWLTPQHSHDFTHCPGSSCSSQFCFSCLPQGFLSALPSFSSSLWFFLQVDIFRITFIIHRLTSNTARFGMIPFSVWLALVSPP